MASRETPILVRVLAVVLGMACWIVGALLFFGPGLPEWVSQGGAALAWVMSVAAIAIAVFWQPRRQKERPPSPAVSSQESETRFRELIAGLDAALFEADRATGVFTFISPRIEEMTGFPGFRWLDGNDFWLGRIHDEDRENVERALTRARQRERPVTVEYRFRNAPGQLRWFRHAMHVSANGTPVRLQGWIEDITDRKLFRRERLRVQRMESLSLLAGGIAHDFNNLLQGIVGSISLARQQADIDSETLEHLELTEQAAKKARGLTQQLLDFSRGGSSERLPAAMGDLVRQTVRFNLGGSNVRAEFAIEPDVPHAEVNDGEIRQALGNLVINADQAMSDGGVLEVRASREEVAADDPLPLGPGAYVRIDLCDEGTGIPGDQLAHIFDPYFSTKPDGSGLGLANAYTIVRRHGGHIEVESTVGRGTRFSVFLPATDAIPQCTEVVPAPTSRGHRVLIMDDEAIILNILGIALDRMGCRCERAENGDQAVALYSRALEQGHPFDLVILDLTIPGGMGGPETLGRIRDIDCGVKAIATSGYVEDPVMLDPAGHGFSRALPKPYDVGVLADTLGKVLAPESR